MVVLDRVGRLFAHGQHAEEARGDLLVHVHVLDVRRLAHRRGVRGQPVALTDSRFRVHCARVSLRIVFGCEMNRVGGEHTRQVSSLVPSQRYLRLARGHAGDRAKS
eukprot:scaffold115728_cov67-Phaeocystis_antarctica.AAC.5